MAMNKKELAMVEELRTQLALSWPTFPEPEPVMASTIQGEAWEAIPPAPRVRHVNVEGHCIKEIDKDGKTVRFGSAIRAPKLYRSELEAWQAIRWINARDYAYKLRAIDRRIEALANLETRDGEAK